ncbi:MAG: rhodanese-like domain-containing protein [Candidatus Gracilibacteria bacterium]|nr:rhodanese-like domain-containing protein [Candidatus Gracilibacteria bacterium]
MTKPSIGTVKVPEFIERRDAGAIVIDLRTPEEILSGKIDDAREMNCYDADFGGKIAKLDISGSYLLYCRSGNRSKQVLDAMGSFGFHDVHDLAGGIGEWMRLGNRVR